MKELIEIQVSLKAAKRQRNDFGKYNYRSCEDILEALKPHLAEKNCFVTLNDEIVLVGDRYYIKATASIYNSEGLVVGTSAFAREPLDKKGIDQSQLTGSCSSYARKYALNGLFAIDDTKDADTMDNRPKTEQQRWEEFISRKEVSDFAKAKKWDLSTITSTEERKAFAEEFNKEKK